MPLLETVKTLIQEDDKEEQRACLNDLRRVVEANRKPISGESPGIKEDELSSSLLPCDVPVKCIPARTTGNGNCLFNAASICIGGDENLSTTLRAGTAVTLCLHAEDLANAEIYDEILKHKDSALSLDTYRAVSIEGHEIDGGSFTETIKAMAVRTCENQRWCVFMHLIALSLFVKQPIWSVYPNANKALRPLLHRQIIFEEGRGKRPIYIMWTRDGNLDSRKGRIFEPNHFVSLLPTHYNDDFAAFDSDDEEFLNILEDIDTQLTNISVDTDNNDERVSDAKEKRETTKAISDERNGNSKAAEDIPMGRNHKEIGTGGDNTNVHEDDDSMKQLHNSMYADKNTMNETNITVNDQIDQQGKKNDEENNRLNVAEAVAEERNENSNRVEGIYLGKNCKEMGTGEDAKGLEDDSIEQLHDASTYTIHNTMNETNITVNYQIDQQGNKNNEDNRLNVTEAVAGERNENSNPVEGINCKDTVKKLGQEKTLKDSMEQLHDDLYADKRTTNETNITVNDPIDQQRNHNNEENNKLNGTEAVAEERNENPSAIEDISLGKNHGEIGAGENNARSPEEASMFQLRDYIYGEKDTLNETIITEDEPIDKLGNYDNEESKKLADAEAVPDEINDDSKAFEDKSMGINYEESSTVEDNTKAPEDDLMYQQSNSFYAENDKLKETSITLNLQISQHGNCNNVENNELKNAKAVTDEDAKAVADDYMSPKNDIPDEEKDIPKTSEDDLMTQNYKMTDKAKLQTDETSQEHFSTGQKPDSTDDILKQTEAGCLIAHQENATKEDNDLTEEMDATESTSIDQQKEKVPCKKKTNAVSETETKDDVSTNLTDSSRKRKFDEDINCVNETDGFSTSDDMTIQELIDRRVQMLIENRMKAKRRRKSDDDFSTSDDMPLKYLTNKNRHNETKKNSKKGKTVNKTKTKESKTSTQSKTRDVREENDKLTDEENIEASGEDCNSDISLESDWDDSSSSDSGAEGGVDDEPSSLQWLTRLQKKNEKPFLGPKPGPKQPVSAKNSPLNVFYQILPESLFEMMAKSTNDYVPIYTTRRRKTKPEWSECYFTPVSAEIMKAYVGIRMIMAIDQKPNMEDYWSTDTSLRNIRISDTMGKRTFKLIQRYFHVNDPTNDPARQADQEKAKEMSRKNPLYKVSPLLEAVRQNSSELYNLHQEISIDEAMVKCHAQHWGIIGAPNKPAKRGFKVFVAADAVSGYLYDFQVYMRKQKEIGLTQRVVENLTEQVYGRNHIVFVDKYYTSVKLALSLFEQKTFLCGSFNVGRKYWPKDLKESKSLKKKDDKVRSLQRGESLTRQTKDKKLVATVWKDKKNVFNLNTYYDPVPKVQPDTVTRRQSNEEGKWEKSEIPCPRAIVKFNKFMGGVDRHDHLRSSYTLQRSSNSWWTYFAWFGIDMALINSYLLYKTAHPKTSHKQFQLKVANQLIGGYSDRMRQANQADPVSLSDTSISNHELVSFSGRPKVCRYCSRMKLKTPAGRTPETSTGCFQCKANIHRMCFTAYHDLLKRKDNVMDKETQTGESLLTPSKDRNSARKTGDDDPDVTRKGVKRRLIGAASGDSPGSSQRKSPRKKRTPKNISK